MHLLFDQRLTDPTGAAVRAALKCACAAANGRRRSGVATVNAQGAKTLAARVAREPQGVYSLTGTRSATDTACLVLAWWTAPGKRKLVRVRAWRERWRPWALVGDTSRVEEKKELSARPAVWHLDPERVVCVEADGTSQWVAVCGCGAAGSPESIAWAGGMCGPCRDRVEEDGPDAVSHPPALLTAPGFAPWAIGFTPDGARVLAMGRVGYRVWDLARGSCITGATEWHNTRTTVPVVGPAGEFVYFNDDTNALVSPGAGNQESVVSVGEPVRAFWTGRPGELVLQQYDLNGRLQLLTLPEGTRGKWVGPPLPGARLEAVHLDPDAPRAAFCANGHVVVSRLGHGGRSEAPVRFRLGDGPYDRTGNWTEEPDLVRFTPDGERLLFVHQNQLELWHVARRKCLVQGQFPGPVADLAFSPDYEHLFALETAGSVAVCHPGLLTHVRARARLKWHARPATALAVSPDGQTLATAGAEGVKLWPVARLLDVL